MEEYDLDDPYLVEFIEKYKDYTYEELGDAFDELNPLDLLSYTRESEYVRSEKSRIAERRVDDELSTIVDS
jgi:hypothetical protein